MGYLEDVSGKIAEYIARPEVVENDEVISAYTLFSAIENCKKRLRHVEEIEKGLLDKLNDIYPQTTRKEKKGLFNKKTKANHFRGIRHYIEDTRIRLCLDGRTSSDDIALFKDYEYSDIYSVKNGLTEEAFNECSNEITTILSELDYFGSLFAKDNKKNESLRFRQSRLVETKKCDGFDLEIMFNNNLGIPKFSYDISVNETIASNGHTDAHFYGKENNVQKVINANMVAILKNTRVDIDKLGYMFYMIVQDYRAMTEQDRIDEEVDKAFQKLYAKK